MKILFITSLFYPHVGGVEKHVLEVSEVLLKAGHKITILTSLPNNRLKKNKHVNNLEIVWLKYPIKKVFGLLTIWLQLFKKRNLILNADIIHIHDVFIWYLPFRLLFRNKKVITTIHGLEWDNPLSINGILQKKMAVKLSDKSVGIGKFLEKFISAKFDLISDGGVDLKDYISLSKINSKIIYVGRLDENTGLLKFLKWLEINNKNKKYHVDFCGNGNLRKECKKYGFVHGFCNPAPYMRKAKICVPGGYLAALEAMAAKCKIMIFWNNQVKKDYWQMTPFYKWIVEGDVKSAFNWAREQTWEKLANQYLDLYKSVLNQ